MDGTASETESGHVISIVDYGMGNLRSVQKAFENVGAEARVVSTVREVAEAEKLVLPGVGAFRDAITHLRDQGLIEPLREVAVSGRPFLGICLGLQLLFDVSYEDGEYRGLGIVPGRVVRFDFRQTGFESELKIPHMGWNQLRWQRQCPLLAGLESGEYVYFVHSYYVEPVDPSVICGITDYGYTFTSMVWTGNLYATQFHPEKSQRAGLRMLRNFAGL